MPMNFPTLTSEFLNFPEPLSHKVTHAFLKIRIGEAIKKTSYCRRVNNEPKNNSILTVALLL